MHSQIPTWSSPWARCDRISAKSHVLQVKSFMVALVSEQHFSLVYRGGFGIYFREPLNTCLTLFLHKMVILILFTHRVKSCYVLTSSRSLSYSPRGSTCTLQLWSIPQSVLIASVCWHLVKYLPHTLHACFQSFLLALHFHVMCPLPLFPQPCDTEAVSFRDLLRRRQIPDSGGSFHSVLCIIWKLSEVNCLCHVFQDAFKRSLETSTYFQVCKFNFGKYKLPDTMHGGTFGEWEAASGVSTMLLCEEKMHFWKEATSTFQTWIPHTERSASAVVVTFYSSEWILSPETSQHHYITCLKQGKDLRLQSQITAVLWPWDTQKFI